LFSFPKLVKNLKRVPFAPKAGNVNPPNVIYFNVAMEESSREANWRSDN
jgi:hypothetical protein